MSTAFTEEPINRSVKLQSVTGLYDTPTCVICGCTENVPCFDGEQACFWVTMNGKTNAGLCSECIGF
jgi:hypothetical protein